MEFMRLWNYGDYNMPSTTTLDENGRGLEVTPIT
jgi:hypothetical protein